MSLADEVEETAPTPRQDGCHACDRLAELPEGRDKTALVRMLTERKSPTRWSWSAKDVWRIARRNGLLIPEADVRDHRNDGHGA